MLLDHDSSTVGNKQSSVKQASSITIVLYGVLLLAFIMRFADSETANFSYLVLAIYALLGRVQAIQALALSWLFTMLSEGVAPIPSAVSVGRYAVIAGAALSVFLRSGLTSEGFAISRPVLATVALGVFLFVHSSFFSVMPDVSLLRAVSWTVVMASLLSAWSGLSYAVCKRLEHQLFGGLALLAVVSVPLVFTTIGYLLNDTGFQGVLNHPQAFGTTVAFLGGWLAGRLLATVRPRWVDVGLLSLCLVLIVISETRTAGSGLMLGFLSAVFVAPLIAGVRARRFIPGLSSHRMHVVACIATMALVFAGAALSERLEDYVLKGSDRAGLVEIAEESRGSVTYQMIANIEENPWTGIGFGIASDPSAMDIERDPLLGLPTSVQVEKGVMPVAVIEELGVLGSLLVAAWLWAMVWRGARSGFAAFAVLATLLFTNLGEATLFSTGGMGLLTLILLAWAVAGRHRPLRNRNRGRNLVLADNR
jgi:hypothetical protein